MNTKEQLFSQMIEAIKAYRNFCDVHNNGFHNEGAFYQNAKAATQAYADFCGITYERAAQMAGDILGY